MLPLWKVRGLRPITLQQIFTSVDHQAVHVYFGGSDLIGVSLPPVESQLWQLDGDVDYLFVESGILAVRLVPGSLRSLVPYDQLERFQKAMFTLYKST